MSQISISDHFASSHFIFFEDSVQVTHIFILWSRLIHFWSYFWCIVSVYFSLILSYFFQWKRLHPLVRFISRHAPRSSLQTQLQFKARPGLRNVECLSQARVTVVAQDRAKNNTHCPGFICRGLVPQRPSILDISFGEINYRKHFQIFLEW